MGKEITQALAALTQTNLIQIIYLGTELESSAVICINTANRPGAEFRNNAEVI